MLVCSYVRLMALQEQRRVHSLDDEWNLIVWVDRRMDEGRSDGFTIQEFRLMLQNE